MKQGAYSEFIKIRAITAIACLFCNSPISEHFEKLLACSDVFMRQ
jgi:hypothetical protein